MWYNVHRSGLQSGSSFARLLQTLPSTGHRSRLVLENKTWPGGYSFDAEIHDLHRRVLLSHLCREHMFGLPSDRSRCCLHADLPGGCEPSAPGEGAPVGIVSDLTLLLLLRIRVAICKVVYSKGLSDLDSRSNNGAWFYGCMPGFCVDKNTGASVPCITFFDHDVILKRGSTPVLNRMQFDRLRGRAPSWGVVAMVLGREVE